jgi:hypothetical protein
MKTIVIVLVLGLAALCQPRAAIAQDVLPNNILYSVMLGVEEQTAFGTAQVVYRGGQSILTYALYSPCAIGLPTCNPLMKAGQAARLVAVNDAGARTVLDRQTIQADPNAPIPYVLKRVTVQSNIIEQLLATVLVLELEADGTVLAAGPVVRLRTTLGTRPAMVAPATMSATRP